MIFVRQNVAVPDVSPRLVKLGSNLCDGTRIGDDHILPVIMNGDYVSNIDSLVYLKQSCVTGILTWLLHRSIPNLG
jgi:hypothetical protein